MDIDRVDSGSEDYSEAPEFPRIYANRPPPSMQATLSPSNRPGVPQLPAQQQVQKAQYSSDTQSPDSACSSSESDSEEETEHPVARKFAQVTYRPSPIASKQAQQIQSPGQVNIGEVSKVGNRQISDYNLDAGIFYPGADTHITRRALQGQYDPSQEPGNRSQGAQGLGQVNINKSGNLSQTASQTPVAKRWNATKSELDFMSLSLRSGPVPMEIQPLDVLKAAPASPQLDQTVIHHPAPPGGYYSDTQEAQSSLRSLPAQVKAAFLTFAKAYMRRKGVGGYSQARHNGFKKAAQAHVSGTDGDATAQLEAARLILTAPQPPAKEGGTEQPLRRSARMAVASPPSATPPPTNQNSPTAKRSSQSPTMAALSKKLQATSPTAQPAEPAPQDPYKLLLSAPTSPTLLEQIKSLTADRPKRQALLGSIRAALGAASERVLQHRVVVETQGCPALIEPDEAITLLMDSTYPAASQETREEVAEAYGDSEGTWDVALKKWLDLRFGETEVQLALQLGEHLGGDDWVLMATLAGGVARIRQHMGSNRLALHPADKAAMTDGEELECPPAAPAQLSERLQRIITCVTTEAFSHEMQGRLLEEVKLDRDDLFDYFLGEQKQAAELALRTGTVQASGGPELTNEQAAAILSDVTFASSSPDTWTAILTAFDTGRKVGSNTCGRAVADSLLALVGEEEAAFCLNVAGFAERQQGRQVWLFAIAAALGRHRFKVQNELQPAQTSTNPTTQPHQRQLSALNYLNTPLTVNSPLAVQGARASAPPVLAVGWGEQGAAVPSGALSPAAVRGDAAGAPLRSQPNTPPQPTALSQLPKPATPPPSPQPTTPSRAAAPVIDDSLAVSAAAPYGRTAPSVYDQCRATDILNDLYEKCRQGNQEFAQGVSTLAPQYPRSQQLLQQALGWVSLQLPAYGSPQHTSSGSKVPLPVPVRMVNAIQLKFAVAEQHLTPTPVAKPLTDQFNTTTHALGSESPQQRMLPYVRHVLTGFEHILGTRPQQYHGSSTLTAEDVLRTNQQTESSLVEAALTQSRRQQLLHCCDVDTYLRILHPNHQLNRSHVATLLLAIKEGVASKGTQGPAQSLSSQLHLPGSEVEGGAEGEVYPADGTGDSAAGYPHHFGSKTASQRQQVSRFGQENGDDCRLGAFESEAGNTGSLNPRGLHDAKRSWVGRLESEQMWVSEMDRTWHRMPKGLSMQGQCRYWGLYLGLPQTDKDRGGYEGWDTVPSKPQMGAGSRRHSEWLMRTKTERELQQKQALRRLSSGGVCGNARFKGFPHTGAQDLDSEELSFAGIVRNQVTTPSDSDSEGSDLIARMQDRITEMKSADCQQFTHTAVTYPWPRQMCTSSLAMQELMLRPGQDQAIVQDWGKGHDACLERIRRCAAACPNSLTDFLKAVRGEVVAVDRARMWGQAGPLLYCHRGEAALAYNLATAEGEAWLTHHYGMGHFGRHWEDMVPFTLLRPQSDLMVGGDGVMTPAQGRGRAASAGDQQRLGGAIERAAIMTENCRVAEAAHQATTVQLTETQLELGKSREAYKYLKRSQVDLDGNPLYPPGPDGEPGEPVVTRGERQLQKKARKELAEIGIIQEAAAAAAVAAAAAKAQVEQQGVWKAADKAQQRQNDELRKQLADQQQAAAAAAQVQRQQGNQLADALGRIQHLQRAEEDRMRMVQPANSGYMPPPPQQQNQQQAQHHQQLQQQLYHERQQLQQHQQQQQQQARGGGQASGGYGGGLNQAGVSRGGSESEWPGMRRQTQASQHLSEQRGSQKGGGKGQVAPVVVQPKARSPKKSPTAAAKAQALVAASKAAAGAATAAKAAVAKGRRVENVLSSSESGGDDEPEQPEQQSKGAAEVEPDLDYGSGRGRKQAKTVAAQGAGGRSKGAKVTSPVPRNISGKLNKNFLPNIEERRAVFEQEGAYLGSGQDADDKEILYALGEVYDRKSRSQSRGRWYNLNPAEMAAARGEWRADWRSWEKANPGRNRRPAAVPAARAGQLDLTGEGSDGALCGPCRTTSAAPVVQATPTAAAAGASEEDSLLAQLAQVQALLRATQQAKAAAAADKERTRADLKRRLAELEDPAPMQVGSGGENDLMGEVCRVINRERGVGLGELPQGMVRAMYHGNELFVHASAFNPAPRSPPSASPVTQPATPVNTPVGNQSNELFVHTGALNMLHSPPPVALAAVSPPPVPLSAVRPDVNPLPAPALSVHDQVMADVGNGARTAGTDEPSTPSVLRLITDELLHVRGQISDMSDRGGHGPSRKHLRFPEPTVFTGGTEGKPVYCENFLKSMDLYLKNMEVEEHKKVDFMVAKLGNGPQTLWESMIKQRTALHECTYAEGCLWLRKMYSNINLGEEAKRELLDLTLGPDQMTSSHVIRLGMMVQEKISKINNALNSRGKLPEPMTQHQQLEHWKSLLRRSGLKSIMVDLNMWIERLPEDPTLKEAVDETAKIVKALDTSDPTLCRNDKPRRDHPKPAAPEQGHLSDGRQRRDSRGGSADRQRQRSLSRDGREPGGDTRQGQSGQNQGSNQSGGGSQGGGQEQRHGQRPHQQQSNVQTRTHIASVAGSVQTDTIKAGSGMPSGILKPTPVPPGPPAVKLMTLGMARLSGNQILGVDRGGMPDSSLRAARLHLQVCMNCASPHCGEHCTQEATFPVRVLQKN